MTKPDTLQEGEHDRWLQVLRGDRARLVNGYFSTKQPGAADLGKNLSFEAAREAEKNFFLSKEPWSSLPAELQRRLGTPKLTEYLSNKLSSYIKQKWVETNVLFKPRCLPQIDPHAVQVTEHPANRLGRSLVGREFSFHAPAPSL